MFNEMKEKLLIVDDQGDLRKMLRIALGYGKYQMFEAQDGTTALRLAREKRPDVMVLDVMMPGELDGFQVCETIKNDPDLRHIFVVLLTALGSDADRKEGERVKADYYMVKPFSPLNLIEVIETRQQRASLTGEGKA